MLLGMGLFNSLKHIFGNNKGVAVVCIIIMSCYCVFTGNSISTIRATIMFIMSFTAQLFGRSYDSLSALGLAAILQLFINPYALNNSGFLLSFLAVVGVTFVSPRLQELLEVKRKITKSLCVSLSASLTTLPVLLWNYGTYPWYSVFLNLLILPVMSVLLFLAVMLTFLIILSGIFSGDLIINTGVMILNIIKTPVIYTIKLILLYMEICCKVFEKAPFQDGYLGTPTGGQIFLYAILLLIAISSLWKHSYFCKKMLLLSAVMILTASVKYGTEITMLDVGQGDGVVIRNSNGNIYISDCGSSSVSQVGKYRLIPFLRYKGYGRIEGIFISHLDEDHISGIVELFDMAEKEKIEILRLFLPESVCGIELDQEKLETILALAKKNRTEVVFLGRGDTIVDGRMQFVCLHPETEDSKRQKETERNNESLVLFLKIGNKNNDFSVILTGDVEKSGEMEILQNIDQNSPLMRCDVLKVAHHGSSGSSSQAFLEAVNPRLSLISCGKDNSYGHPHEETLERLESVGSQIMSTTESGAITLKIGRDIKVYEHKK